MEKSAPLDQYNQAYFDARRLELTQSPQTEDQERAHRLIDTVVLETLSVLQSFKPFAELVEKKEKTDFKTFYENFLALAKDFTVEEKDRPLFNRIKTVLASIDSLPKRAKKEVPEEKKSSRASPSTASQSEAPPVAPSRAPSFAPPPSGASNTPVRKRKVDPAEIAHTRDDVPRSANPFDINSVSKNINDFKRKELDYMILISCIDSEMRETVTLNWSASTCILEVIEDLLAIPENTRDFKAAQISLVKRLDEMREEEVRLYKSLIGARGQVIKQGKKVDITPQVKLQLIASFDALVKKKFEDAAKEFPLTETQDLEYVKEVLEQRIEDKLLLKDELLESKVDLQMQSEDIKSTPEYKQLVAARKILRGAVVSLTLWDAVEHNEKEHVQERWESGKGFLETFLPTNWLSPAYKSINLTNTLGYTALHIASYHGHEALVDELLAKGATRAIPDRSGYNALHWAACQGHTAICRKLLAKDLSILDAEAQVVTPKKIEYGYKRTPLHRAAWHGRADTVLFLIESGANVNARTSKGDGCKTPLHEAVEQGKDVAVGNLLKSDKIDVEIPDDNGSTAYASTIVSRRTDYLTRILAHRSYRKGKAPEDPNSLESLFNKTKDAKVKEVLKELMGQTNH